jgi:hypothetical protein
MVGESEKASISRKIFHITPSINDGCVLSACLCSTLDIVDSSGSYCSSSGCLSLISATISFLRPYFPFSGTLTLPSQQTTKPRASENGHPIRRTAHPTRHVQGHEGSEKRVPLQLVACFCQSFEVEELTYFRSEEWELVEFISVWKERENLPIGIPQPANRYSCMETSPGVGKTYFRNQSPPNNPRRAVRTKAARGRLPTSQEIASPATAAIPPSQSHSSSSRLASTPACSGVFCAAYAFFWATLQESHSGITPVRMKRMSPRLGEMS